MSACTTACTLMLLWQQQCLRQCTDKVAVDHAPLIYGDVHSKKDQLGEVTNETPF